MMKKLWVLSCFISANLAECAEETAGSEVLSEIRSRVVQTL